MASNINVQGLEARNEFGHVILTWSVVDPNVFTPGSTAMLDQVEIWASTSPNMAGATKVVEARNTAVHASVIEGATYYYQARARDLAGAFGAFYPATYAVPCLIKYANSAAQDLQNLTISLSIASGALVASLKTLSGDDPAPLNPVVASFRPGDGSVVYRQQAAPLALTLPVSFTFGTPASTRFRIWWVLVDDNGALTFGAIKTLPTATPTIEGQLVTTAAASGAGAGNIIYTASAIGTPRAFRVLGYTDFPSGQAFAGGNWTLPGNTLTIPRFEGMKLLDDGSSGASIAVNGYWKLPSGLIIQWGVSSGSNASGIASAGFAITFPTQCFLCVGNSSNNNTNYVVSAQLNSLFTSFATFLLTAIYESGGTLHREVEVGATVYWIAIGY